MGLNTQTFIVIGSYFFCALSSYFRGRKIYEPPRYLTANDAIKQILDIVKSNDDDDEQIEGKDCEYTTP